MSGWWISDLYQQGQIITLISWIFWIIFSITLHELAHGWTAIWQGDDTPRRLGRLTLNPYVHMGPMSLLVFAVIGIAWGLMPVDRSKFRWRKWGSVLVSAAGPAMNVVLAIIALTAAAALLRFGNTTGKFQHNALEFLFTGGWLNLLLAAFNLLPIPPLDGSSILSGLSIRVYRLYQHPNAQIAGFALLMVLVFSGITSYAFYGVIKLSFWYATLLGGVTPDVYV